MNDVTNAAWTPQCSYDLLNGNAFSFAEMIKSFREWSATQPLPPLSLASGVHVITPQVAEELLRRNDKNRQVGFQAVYAYAVQIANGHWQMTGQPIICTDAGALLDGQHRLWACYLVNRPITTYVVVGVPHQDDLFAYIDNNRPRTGADALQIAGLNGAAQHIASVVKEIALRWDEGLWTLRGVVKNITCSNKDVLDYVKEHHALVEAVKLLQAVYPVAVKRLGNPKVASFVAWKIAEQHGRDVLDEFFLALEDSHLPDNHPVAALKKKVVMPPPKRGMKAETVPLREVLAYTIMAFNMMYSTQRATTRNFKIDLRDDFPSFVEPGERNSALDDAA